MGVKNTGTGSPGSGHPLLSGECCPLWCWHGLDRDRLAFPALLTKLLCNNGESQPSFPTFSCGRPEQALLPWESGRWGQSEQI